MKRAATTNGPARYFLSFLPADLQAGISYNHFVMIVSNMMPPPGVGGTMSMKV